MEFRPFGVDDAGNKVRDVSGVIVQANVRYLEETMVRNEGSERGRQVVEELCRLLNERIREPEYHVTPRFLENPWNSYSYEFVCYLREFCEQLSGDPQFHFNVGRAKMIPSSIEILGRPFSLAQIYRMWPHFGQKYTRGSVLFGVGPVTDHSAVLRFKFTEKASRQFGAYRSRCAELVCRAAKGGLSSIPEKAHGLPCATVTDRLCIAKGDEWCEWEFRWTRRTSSFFWWLWGSAVGAAILLYLHVGPPGLSMMEAMLIALMAAGTPWLVAALRLHRLVHPLQRLIEEQERTVETRHEELREAYLEQEHITVKLRRTVRELTTLHRASLLFNSTHELDPFLDCVLKTIVNELHYERAMISFFDRTRKMVHGSRVLGMSEEIAEWVRTREVPVTDPDSVEGTVLLQGQSVLNNDIGSLEGRLHPLNRELIGLADVKSFMAVPLSAKDEILGCIAVERSQERPLTDEDLNVISTVANHVAIALDNLQAYRQIEALNVGLEARVQERTAELRAANDKLEAMDRLKSQFIAHVSHELRTPLTSITGFAENMLEGLGGATTERQRYCLSRITSNAARLGRMITDLLDRSRIEAGKLQLSLGEVSLAEAAQEVVEQFQPLARAKRQLLQLRHEEPGLLILADADRLNQILTNLIDNAVKYTPAQGVVTVVTRREGTDFALVSVKDTGIGIDRGAIPRLFDPFFRVGRKETARVKGLGLGLSIVKELVERHGGSITVRSDHETGTEFQFTLPLCRRSEERGWSPSSPTGRLLLADDDPDILQLMQDRLESEGFAVVVATNGREALNVLARTSVDGVILDIGMPELNGLDVLARIREQTATLPIVLITAAESQEQALRGMQAGAQAFLLKPFDFDEFRLVMRRWFSPVKVMG